jgi:hypothetical protein
VQYDIELCWLHGHFAFQIFLDLFKLTQFVKTSAAFTKLAHPLPCSHIPSNGSYNKFRTLTDYFPNIHSTLNSIRQSPGTSTKWPLPLGFSERNLALFCNFPTCHQSHSSSSHSVTIWQHKFLTMRWQPALVTLFPSDSDNVPLSRILTKRKVIVPISPKLEEIFLQKTQVTTVNPSPC